MYHVARNYDQIKTHQTWQWYLWRAAQSSIRATGGAGTGLMDGTVFREVLNALKAEAAADPTAMLGNKIPVTAMRDRLDTQSQKRQANWARQQYPYGSEFGSVAHTST